MVRVSRPFAPIILPLFSAFSESRKLALHYKKKPKKFGYTKQDRQDYTTVQHAENVLTPPHNLSSTNVICSRGVTKHDTIPVAIVNFVCSLELEIYFHQHAIY